MNRIVEGIYVGDAQDAAQLAQANPNGITAILNVRSEATDCPLSGAAMMNVPLIDGEPIVEKEFWACMGWLDEMRNRNKTILIHCAAGVSRSITICAAFMKRKGLASSMDNAFTVIKANRTQAGPSPVVWASAKGYLGEK